MQASLGCPWAGASLSEPSSLHSPLPVGQMGTVRYVLASIPTTTASHIQVDFSVS